jgi:hypothetical protein
MPPNTTQAPFSRGASYLVAAMRIGGGMPMPTTSPETAEVEGLERFIPDAVAACRGGGGEHTASVA